MNLEIISNYAKHSDHLQQKEILEYFDSLKNNPDGWKICAEALLNDSINEETAIFFCFQVIEDYIKSRYHNDLEQNHLIVKQLIFSLFDKEILETNYLQNKYAHLVNSLFLIDYPQQKWNSFFKDFLDRCGTKMKCELFLRILIQLNLDIADREIPRTAKEMQRSTLIKDMMRETCLVDLAQFWFNVINTYRETCPPVVCLCLEVIGAYVSWIDINLITNDSIMPILFMLFSHVQYRFSVVDCFNCILRKGMDPFAKTRLIEEFLNFNLIKSTLANIFSKNNDSPEFVEKFASLINTIGIEIIEAHKKLKAKVNANHNANDLQIMSMISEAIETKFSLLGQFLSYDVLSVCLRVHPSVRDYIQWLKSSLKDDSDQALQRNLIKEKTWVLLTIIVEKNKQLSSLFKPEDEFFNEFRKSSKILFDNLMLLNPTGTISFICDNVVLPTLVNWKTNSMTFSDIEVCLYYFHMIGENTNLMQDVKMIENLIQTLITSSISLFPNPITQSLYFDLLLRYEKFFNSSLNNLLSAIIISFLDERGLRNSNIKIRSKVCKIFNKFIKSYIKSKNTQAEKTPFIDDILKRIQDFLDLDIVFDSPEDLIEQDLEHLIHSSYLVREENIKFAYPMSASNQLHIYETVTFLIISSQHDNRHKKELLKALFTKVWDKHREYQEQSHMITLYLNQNGFTDEINKKNLYEKRLVTNLHLSHTIDVIAATTKSFSTVNTVKLIGVQSLYLSSFEFFIKSVHNNFDSDTQHILQSSIRHFLHRLIVCLDEEEMIPILPDAIQTLFLSSPEISSKSVQELIPLFSQIIPKYKHSWLFQRDISSFLDRIFSPLILLFFKLIFEANVESEKIHLQKSYYTFLHLLSSHGLMQNFFDSETQLIEKILGSLIEGMVRSTDCVIQRTCCQVLANLVEVYVNDSNSGQVEKKNRPINTYFVRFIYDQLILACLMAAYNGVDDFATIQESLHCLRKMKQLLGEELVQFVRQEIVPKYFHPMFNSNINNNNNNNVNVEDILNLLLTSDLKAFRKQIRQTIQSFQR